MFFQGEDIVFTVALLEERTFCPYLAINSDMRSLRLRSITIKNTKNTIISAIRIDLGWVINRCFTPIAQ